MKRFLFLYLTTLLLIMPAAMRALNSPCPSPIIYVDEIGSDYATTGWDANDATSWNILFGVAPAAWYYGTVTTNSYTFTGLIPNTNYHVVVEAQCGSNNMSDFSEHFTTLFGLEPTCPAPANFTVFNVSSNGAGVSWDQPGGGDQWIIQYSTNSDFSNPSEITFGSSSMYLYGLTPSTTYYARVANSCGSAGMSLWSNTETFTTTESPCLAPTNITVSNITYNGAELTWDQPGGGGLWRIEISTDPTFTSPSVETSYNTYLSFTELYPITTYYVRVANNCGTIGNSAWVTTSFTTTGGVIIIPEIINFESGTVSEYPFDNDATYPWMIADAAHGCDNGSVYCMRSGNAGIENSTSSINASYDFSEDGYIAFDAKCMGEYSDYDVCKFSIDGAEQFSIDVADWNHYSYAVSSGFHTFTWSYSKDGSVNNPGDGFFVDNIEFGLGTLCATPTNFTVSNVGSNGAGVSWNQPGAGDQWIIQYSTNSDFSNPSEITVGSSAMYLYGLTPSTTYYARVANSCGSAGMSLWSNTETFTTTESPCIAPTNLTVSNITYNGAELTWDQPDGGFDWQIEISTSPTFASPTVEFSFDAYLSLSGLLPITTYYVRVANDCGTLGNSEWVTTSFTTTGGVIVISDFIDFETGDFNQFPFFQDSNYPWSIVDNTIDNGCDNGSVYCMRSGNEGIDNSTSSIDASYDFSEDGYIAFDAKCMGEASQFDVCKFYIDGTEQFSIAVAGWTHYSYAVSAGPHTFSWSYVKDGSVSNTGDGFFVDNIEFGGGGSVYCPTPTNVSVSVMSPYSARMTWDQLGGGSECHVQYSKDPDFSTVLYDGFVYDNDFWMSNLSVSTTYYVRVANFCGTLGASDWVTMTFTTLDPPCPIPINLTLSNLSDHGAQITWDQPGGGFEWRVYVSPNSDFVTPCSMWFPNETSVSISGLSPATTYYVQVANNCGNSQYSWSEVLTFTTEAGELCPNPVGLTASNIGMQEATISWDTDNSVDSWEVEYGTTADFSGATHVTTLTNSLDLTGLTIATPYYVRVKASCSNGYTSGWANYHFVTQLCPTADQCVIRYELHDYYEDGWNYAAINVVDVATDELLDSWSIGWGYNYVSGFLSVCEGREIKFQWVNGYYEEETSYTVYDVNGSVIFSGSNALSEPVYYTTNCSAPPCPVPTDLTAIDVTSSSVMLGWTENGTATEWQLIVNNDETNILEVLTNSNYILEGLAAETEYIVKVRAKCGDNWSDWSDPVTFTTGVDIPPFFYITGDDSICPNQTTNLTVNTNMGNNYVWSNDATSETITVTVGEYTVSVYNDHGEFTASGSFNVLAKTTYNITVNDAVCESELPYMWNDITFTTAGTQSVTLQAVNGCDSVVTMTLTVNPTYAVTDAQTICANELPYSWNGVTFTAAGTQNVTLQTVNGCDSVVSMTLTVTPTYDVTDARTICASELPYTWNGVTFTAAGTQNVTLHTVNGCDSVVTMTLTVNPTYAVTDAQTICESQLPYTWNGVNFTAAGTQSVTLHTVNGCDSVVTMNLTVNPTYTVTDAQTICASQLPYTWNGVTFTAAGTQSVTLHTVNGCDSVVTMNLTVNPIYAVTDAQTICANQLPYTWNGVTFTAAGTQSVTLHTVNGCDSVVTMNLTVNPTYAVTDAQTICASQLPYTWNGVTFTAAGTQEITLHTVNGCDSVVTMTLTVNPIYAVAEAREVCPAGLPYTWNGVTFTAAGTQVVTLPTVNGCDSVVTMTLTVNEAYTITENRTICENALPLTWNGYTFTEAGTHEATLIAANGCDSLVTMVLTVNPSYAIADAQTICANELPYTWNGVTFTAAGTENVTLHTVNGCDSVVTMTLTVNPIYAVTDAQTICESELPYSWNGVTFNAAGTQNVTLQAANGCDSVVTMTLTVNPTYAVTDVRSVCPSELPYTWNGVSFNTAGTQNVTLQTANGCDSVVTMFLTVNQTQVTSDSRTICESELPYTWNGVTFTAAGMNSATLQGANGCDSTVIMTLIVNPAYAISQTMSICESELPYTWNGIIFTAAGSQSISLQTANGCDSVVTMILTVNPTYAVTDVRNVCPSELPYTWNGVVFSTAGTQNVTLQTTNGCDSVVTMLLTVNQTQVTSDSRTICESELPYTWNGVTFSAAGMNTATLQDANGCDSTVIMTLIVNLSSTSEFTMETSDSCYVWNGQAYCASGDYVQTLQTVNGCDSVVTLHLTTSVGVENHELSVVFLAPNPTQNICRIVGLETDPVSVELFDMRGKMVMRDDDTELDVSKLPTGMYMVRVNTGDRVINLKLIKQ